MSIWPGFASSLMLPVDLDLNLLLRHLNSRFTASGRCPRINNRLPAVLDHVLELMPEVLQETLHRPGCRIAKRADGMPLNLVGHVEQQIQVLLAGLSVP